MPSPPQDLPHNTPENEVTRTVIERPSSNWAGWAQWLALFTMTVDHVVRYLLPESWDASWASSSIGRVALPLFAGMVAWHGLFNTSDPVRYARRILVIGLVAQLPYMTMPRDGFQLNICFTLAMGLVWGSWLDGLIRKLKSPKTPPLKLLLGAVVATASLVLWWLIGPWVEYGHVGLLLVPLYMLALHQARQPAPAWQQWMLSMLVITPLLVCAGLMNTSIMAKSITLMTTLVVVLMAAGGASLVREVPWNMPRRVWLAWYPVHFAVIALLLHGRALI